MARRTPNTNPGAVVALLGALVFVIGLVGTIVTVLMAAREGRGGGTIFYGAMIWGVLQFILGLIQSARQINAGKTVGLGHVTIFYGAMIWGRYSIHRGSTYNGLGLLMKRWAAAFAVLTPSFFPAVFRGNV